jgi:hypothetical protein
MDSGEKFWVSIWALAATVVTVLILAIMNYNIYTINAVTALVDKGVSPIAAYCAVHGTSELVGKSIICFTEAQQEANK